VPMRSIPKTAKLPDKILHKLIYNETGDLSPVL